MKNRRQLGRWFFALLALMCTAGFLMTFLDHAKENRRELQAIAMAIMTHACVTAVKCLED